MRLDLDKLSGEEVRELLEKRTEKFDKLMSKNAKEAFLKWMEAVKLFSKRTKGGSYSVAFHDMYKKMERLDFAEYWWLKL